MPKKARELTALEVRRIIKAGFYPVGGVSGLALYVKESGARSWILRKKVGQRRPDIGLGGFPDVKLEQARDKARHIAEQIRQGIDPLAARKEAAAALRLATAKALTFDEAALNCHTAKKAGFRNDKHKADWMNSIKTHVSPVIGSLPVGEIEQPHILKVLQPIWETKTETATRVRQRIEAVLAWAIASKYRTGDNPARWKGSLEHSLAAANKVRRVMHHAALPWQEVGAFMVDLRNAEGMGARALEFAILTAARSGEVRGAVWDEISLAEKLWTIPGKRMKAGKAHRVPLTDDAIRILKALPRFDDCPYVFASPRGKMLSDMTLSAVTRRMKVDVVPHGFRSTFKDWARSNTNYPDEVSELALAHISSDETRAAYARDELLPKRRLLMIDWAKYCGTVQRKAGVVPLRKAKKP
jgi:integrase